MWRSNAFFGQETASSHWMNLGTPDCHVVHQNYSSWGCLRTIYFMSCFGITGHPAALTANQCNKWSTHGIRCRPNVSNKNHALLYATTHYVCRSSPGPLTDRPVRYNVPGSSSRVVLILDWHLTKFQQRETDFLMLRALDRLVQTAIGMSKGDEPILNGRVIFRSPSLKLVAQDHVLLGGFTYGVLATAIRGLGELVYTYGANGVDVDVYAGGNKMVGTLEFDFIL